jgi:AraC-like DNA-binding protein
MCFAYHYSTFPSFVKRCQPFKTNLFVYYIRAIPNKIKLTRQIPRQRCSTRAYSDVETDARTCRYNVSHMAVDTHTRLIYEYPAGTPIGFVGRSSVYENSRWDFEGPRTIFFYSLTYVLEGSCRYTEPSGCDLIFSPGDLFFCFPGIPHRIDPLPGAPFSEFWITFGGPTFDVWRDVKVLDHNRPCVHLEPIEYWLPRFEGLFTNVRADTWGQMILVTALQGLIAEVLSLRKDPAANPGDSGWLAQAKMLIERASQTDLDIGAIADQMDMSHSTFRHKFVALAGMPPARYHARKMMQAVCAFMALSNYGNKEIAERFGFCNEYYFSRRFKQVVGETPNEYRARLQQNNSSEMLRWDPSLDGLYWDPTLADGGVGKYVPPPNPPNSRKP